ncbi:ribonuclease Oy isoform X1 [Anolis carolinensis]|uniref:ribonuclease Oy isoform X1 n=1 Tax=Anolis carolinensis TaxID=28377 RepID=UPI002F2B25A3
MGKVPALWSLCLLLNGFVWLFVMIGSEQPWQKAEAVHSEYYCPWQCLTFVQMWPGSFCVALATRFECVLPKNANSWTIHGLWPSDITACCRYWYLFPSDLTDLMPDLNWHWPSFINLSNFLFWEKEWHKHGTCGGCVETLNSPSKYFRAALDLRTKYNIDSAFQKARIVPSCNCSYQLSSFQAALQPTLGDQYELQYVTDIQERQILVQIKISLSANFSTGCIQSGSHDGSPYKPCQAQENIFYFPPNLENPRDPCP